MAQRRALWPIVRRIWITTGLGATAVFVTWSLVAYRASAEARRATVSDAAVAVARDGGIWRFEPTAGAKDPTLVFFPGALVDPRDYAPLAVAVALGGHRVIMIELPWRGAFGGAESPELRMRVHSALESLGDSRAIVLGGHSRGATTRSSAGTGSSPWTDGRSWGRTSSGRS